MSDFRIVQLANPIQLNLTGPSFTGAYSGSTAYTAGQSVSYNGSSYVALVSTTGNLPTNTAYWQLLAAKGDTGNAGLDTNIVSPVNNQTLFYDSASLKWVNHTLVKGDVGLSNVDNTSDANKPISTATATALSGKEPTITAGTTSQYWRGDKSWQTLNKSAVGLSNVDNTSDINKPISTATQTALNTKIDNTQSIINALIFG